MGERSEANPYPNNKKTKSDASTVDGCRFLAKESQTKMGEQSEANPDSLFKRPRTRRRGMTTYTIHKNIFIMQPPRFSVAVFCPTK